MRNYFKFFHRACAPLDNYSIALSYEDDFAYRVCPRRSSPVCVESTSIQIARFRIDGSYYYAFDGPYGNFYSDLTSDKLDVDQLVSDIEDNYYSLYNLYKLIVDYETRKKNSKALG